MATFIAPISIVLPESDALFPDSGVAREALLLTEAVLGALDLTGGSGSGFFPSPLAPFTQLKIPRELRRLWSLGSGGGGLVTALFMKPDSVKECGNVR